MSAMRLSLADIEAVYRERGSDFFRLALARLGEVETAREAVQEGFAAAIRGRDTYQGRGSVEAWIARCVINAARDLARPEQAPPTDDQLNAVSSHGVDAAIVRQAVRQLPQRQRDALYLRFYMGFDYAAIAQTLGIEIGTVSATLHAARTALAQNLKEEVAG